MNKEAKLIGHYTLKKPKIMTKLFEYAAYYQNIEVPAGVYPAFKLTDDYELVNFTEVRDGELLHISRIALIETKEKEKEILPPIEKTREKEDSYVQEDKDYETQQREL